jgi:hypothetical protein
MARSKHSGADTWSSQAAARSGPRAVPHMQARRPEGRAELPQRREAWQDCLSTARSLAAADGLARLLHDLGFSVQRPRKRLARADAEKQAVWLGTTFPAIKKPPRVAAS